MEETDSRKTDRQKRAGTVEETEKRGTHETDKRGPEQWRRPTAEKTDRHRQKRIGTVEETVSRGTDRQNRAGTVEETDKRGTHETDKRGPEQWRRQSAKERTKAHGSLLEMR